MIYKKLTYDSIFNSLSASQKVIFNKIFVYYDDDKIEINDVEFAKLPLAWQNKITLFLEKQGFILK